MNFFETFPICPLQSTVSKNTIKMIGHHFRLREMMGQSYPIYACTHANHARYSSVQVTFCGSSKHSLLKQYLGNNLTGRKCRAYRTISYKICGNTHTTLNDVDVKRSYSRYFHGHNLNHRVTVLCTLSPIYFFPSDKIF